MDRTLQALYTQYKVLYGSADVMNVNSWILKANDFFDTIPNKLVLQKVTDYFDLTAEHPLLKRFIKDAPEGLSFADGVELLTYQVMGDPEDFDAEGSVVPSTFKKVKILKAYSLSKEKKRWQQDITEVDLRLAAVSLPDFENLVRNYFKKLTDSMALYFWNGLEYYILPNIIPSNYTNIPKSTDASDITITGFNYLQTALYNIAKKVAAWTSQPQNLPSVDGRNRLYSYSSEIICLAHTNTVTDITTGSKATLFNEDKLGVEKIIQNLYAYNVIPEGKIYIFHPNFFQWLVRYSFATDNFYGSTLRLTKWHHLRMRPEIQPWVFGVIECFTTPTTVANATTLSFNVDTSKKAQSGSGSAISVSGITISTVASKAIIIADTDFVNVMLINGDGIQILQDQDYYYYHNTWNKTGTVNGAKSVYMPDDVLGNTKVSATFTQDSSIPTGTTNLSPTSVPAGSFTFNNLSAGNYRIIVSAYIKGVMVQYNVTQLVVV